MNTPAQCGAIKPPQTDIYSEAPHSREPGFESRLPLQQDTPSCQGQRPTIDIAGSPRWGFSPPRIGSSADAPFTLLSGSGVAVSGLVARRVG